MTLLSMIQQFYPEVKRVKDATKDLSVEVTKRDINSTAVKKHKECAIAVACRKKEDYNGAIVGISKAFLIKGEVATRFDVPVSAQKEIISFDRGGIFEPGEYHLKKPFTKLGEHHTKSGPKSKSPQPKRYHHVTEGIRASLKI